MAANFSEQRGRARDPLPDPSNPLESPGSGWTSQGCTVAEVHLECQDVIQWILWMSRVQTTAYVKLSGWS